MREGCATCEQAKLYIRWPEDPVGQITLDSISQQALRILALNQDRLERELREAPVKCFHPELSKDAGALARAIATLTDSKRKLDESAASDVRQMTLEQRCELMLDWLDQLPLEKRKRMLQSAVDRLGRDHALPANVEE